MIAQYKETQLELFAAPVGQDKKMVEFIEYVLDFYSPESELYPEMAFTREEVVAGYAERLIRHQEHEFEGDTVDREWVRDIVLEMREAE